MNIKEIDKKYVANTYNRFDLEIVSGKGAYCYDENGKEYIDMTSGIGVNIFGYSDKEWCDAVTAQANKLQHTSNLYYTQPCTLLAQKLCERTGMKKVFFSNSGAEANECAIKVARKYMSEKKGGEYYNIITLKNSFHGRTLTTLSATGQDGFHTLFNPLTQGFLYAEPNDISSLKTLVNNNKVAAVMIECIQGESGVNVLDFEYVVSLYKLCRDNDILLIVDEVQTGNGRTGKLYSYMNYGIEPDIVTTAKGLAGGLPMGATLLNERTENVLTYSTHGSTFGGNPVCASAALSVLDRIDEELLFEVVEKGKYIKNELKDLHSVQQISGMGLMIGIKTEKIVSDVIAQCMQNGVLCLSAKDRLRLLPPLNISWEALKKAVSVIKNSLK